MSSGALSADPALEEHVRKEYKLPERSSAWTNPKAPNVADPMAALPDGATPAATEPASTEPDQGNTTEYA